jgi:hypothetical protein
MYRKIKQIPDFYVTKTKILNTLPVSFSVTCS